MSSPTTFYESLGHKVVSANYFTPAIEDYRRCELDFLAKNIPDDSKVLELLCGKGNRAAALSKTAKEYVCMERSQIAKSMAARTNKPNKNVKVIEGDGSKVPFDDNHFDYSFIAFNNLFTVPNEQEILTELARVTKNKVFISVYAEGSLAERLKFYESCGFDIVSINHGKVFTREGFSSVQHEKAKLLKLFSSAGLSVQIESLCGIGSMCIAEKVTPSSDTGA